MDYKDFTTRQAAYDGFVMYRREVLESSRDGSFQDVFTELCTRALAGDCIAQDCAAYFFNKGVPNFVAPNYEYYMSWEILAGANGNEFALEKLEFFLNSALDQIVYDEQLLQTAFERGNLTKQNALMMISNLLCEGIADQLKLNPKKLITISKTPAPYTPQKARIFTDAMDKCLIDVAKFLIS